MAKKVVKHRSVSRNSEFGENVVDTCGSSTKSSTSKPKSVARDQPAHFFAGVLWLLAVACYLRTQYLGIPGGDSGELVAISCRGGVAHPPGYPTYTFLTEIILSALPFGTPHQRASTISAVFTATAGTLLFSIVNRMLPDRGAWPALASAGLYLFSPLIWLHGIQPEVFALNNLITCAILWLLVVFMTSPDARRVQTVACTAAFLAGLSLTNQHTIVLFLLPTGVVALWRRRRMLSPGLLLLCVALGLLGLLPLLRLVLKARPSAQFSWGDTATWEGFKTHFLRREYGSFMLTGSKSMQQKGSHVANFVKRIGLYLSDFTWRQAAVVGLPLALTGAAQAYRGSAEKMQRHSWRGLHVAVIGAWLFYVAVFHWLANIDLEREIFHTVQARFWQQPNLLLFMYLGPGLRVVVDGLALNRAIEAPLVLLLLTYQVAGNWRELDHSADDLISSFARDILSPLPKNSMLLACGEDNYHPLMYMQACEGLRPDIRIVSKELITAKWYKPQQSPHLPGVVFPADYMLAKGRGGASAQGGRRALSAQVLLQTGLHAGGLPAWPSTWEWLVLDAYWSSYYAMAWHLTKYGQSGLTGQSEHKWIVGTPVPGRRKGAEAWGGKLPDDAQAQEVDGVKEARAALTDALELYGVLEGEDRRRRKLLEIHPMAEIAANYTFDASFDGYVYKNSGFVYSLFKNEQKMAHFYRMFLLVGPKTDPNYKQLQQIVASAKQRGAVQ
ncbi:hypothetical protein CYMTET_28606 [Cymbomonas tetramitiformis]|uniref:DUF2723 domain-containing protein n=1 Tax=Cymbomonas tetramitiformis TaxID=36881 RepID=A0AAE0FMK9_9CHLO|nr:hypothetical protein CYMTET_28606 [Cymbomonas tetramitiformis]